MTGSQVRHARPKPSHGGQRADFCTVATRSATFSEDRINPVPDQVGHRATFGGGAFAEFVSLGLGQEDLCSHHWNIIMYTYSVMMYIRIVFVFGRLSQFDLSERR